MLIDIIQAYADAMYVATTLQAPPAPRCRSLPAAAPAPALGRRIVHWVTRRLRRLETSDPVPASDSSRLAVPKI